MLMYDLINMFYAAALVFILFYKYKINMNYYLIIIGHLVLVFLTNDFLFPVDYMPDQYRYIGAASCIRNNLMFIDYLSCDRTANVAFAGLLFASFPIPFIESVFSLGVVNFLIYAFLFVFLYKKKILKGNVVWFYLFFPSFALYSALALRETFILLFMILSIYALYKKQTLLSIIIALPLIIIKTQNFFIYILALLIYKAVNHSRSSKILNSLKFLFFAISGGVFISFFSLEEINFVRLALYGEEYHDLSNYIPIETYFDLIYEGFMGVLHMILKPLIWESTNIVQIIQSLENIVIFYIIYRILKYQYYFKDDFIRFLIIYFFIGMTIYGLVTFNFGTAARYRYTFVVVFILFSMFRIYQYKLNTIYKRKD